MVRPVSKFYRGGGGGGNDDDPTLLSSPDGRYHWNLRSIRQSQRDLAIGIDSDENNNNTNTSNGKKQSSSTTTTGSSTGIGKKKWRPSMSSISSATSATSSATTDDDSNIIPVRELPDDVAEPMVGLGSLRNQQRLEQCAIDIFGPNNDNGGCTDSNGNEYDKERIRIGMIDGHEVKFELQENVNEKPAIERRLRIQRTINNSNVTKSSMELRLRFWLMKCQLVQISCLYLASFIVLNVIFAGLFYIEEENCCEDSTLSYAEVFDFTIQTSTTIGYGGYVPVGHYSNFLVVMLSYFATLLNTIFAGLYFVKFVTPTAKIIFSDVITLSNVNGLPCLQLRVGNADGYSNLLTEATARLTYTYVINYQDEHGTTKTMGHTEELKLLNDKQHQFVGVWTLRHVVDETSPLFGLNFTEHPGNSIVEFRVMISTIQDSTKSSFSEQTGYLLEDLLIGHTFDEQSTWDMETRKIICDYSKMSSTHPKSVWYPSSK